MGLGLCTSQGKGTWAQASSGQMVMVGLAGLPPRTGTPSQEAEMRRTTASPPLAGTHPC